MPESGSPTRGSHLSKIIRWSRFVIYEIGGLALSANLDLLIGKYGSDRTKTLWEQWTRPHWGWKLGLLALINYPRSFFIEGSYRAHRETAEEKEKYRQKLEDFEKSLPAIVLHSRAQYVEDAVFRYGNMDKIVRSIKVRFINKTPIHSTNSIAKGVRAKVSFFSTDNDFWH